MVISFGPYLAMSWRRYSSVTLSDLVQYRISYSCSKLIRRLLRKFFTSWFPNILAPLHFYRSIQRCWIGVRLCLKF